MEVRYSPNDRISIYPETDFERNLLSHFRDFKAFLKGGLSPADVVAFVIDRDKNPPPSNCGLDVDEDMDDTADLTPDQIKSCPHCLSTKIFKVVNTTKNRYTCDSCLNTWTEE